MKKILFSICFAALALSANAQLLVSDVRNSETKKQVDKCALKVVYRLTFYVDTLKKRPTYDNQILEVGGTVSHFYSAIAEELDSTMWRARQIHDNGVDRGVKLRQNIASDEDSFYEDIFINNPQKGMLTHRSRLVSTDYQYTEPTPIICWVIGAQTKEIKGYKCQNATAMFGKRKWEAWFTTQIPVSMGPYKFGGLPGLILSVKDDKELFVYELIGVEQPKNRAIYNYFPNKPVVKLSRKQMYRLWDQRWQDPVSLYTSVGKIVVSDGRDLKPGDIRNLPIPTVEIE